MACGVLVNVSKSIFIYSELQKVLIASWTSGTLFCNTIVRLPCWALQERTAQVLCGSFAFEPVSA